MSRNIGRNIQQKIKIAKEIIIFFMPVVRLHPIQSFNKRLRLKVSITYGTLLGTNHFRFIKVDSHQNVTLKCTRDLPVGKKDSLIQIPFDFVIFKNVIANGSWGLDECMLICEEISKFPTRTRNRLHYVDIGAHCGIFIRQIANISQVPLYVTAYEPRNATFLALKFNTNYLSKSSFDLQNAALTTRAGKATLRTNRLNIGNSSLISDSSHSIHFQEQTVNTLDSTMEFSRILEKGGIYILKCDIEGLEIEVLKSIPTAFWNMTACALIEVWPACNSASESIQNLIKVFELNFKLFLQDLTGQFEEITCSALFHYWRDPSKPVTNLFMTRKSHL